MATANEREFNQVLGLEGLGSPELVCSIAEMERQPTLLGITSALRRAFGEMNLSAVLLRDGQPLAYIAELVNDEPCSDSAIKLQRQLWSQGLSPLLLVLTPKRFHIYSGLLPPKESTPEQRLIETFVRATQALEIRACMLGVVNGDLFRRRPEAFPSEHRVDKRLLKNLQSARQALLDIDGKSDEREPLPIEIVDRLLCRIVFTSYLIDRDVLGRGFMLNTPAFRADRPSDLFRLWRQTPTKAGKRLFERFRKLRTHFNGDLFAGNLDEEESLLHAGHWEVFRDWLTGTEFDTGQLSFVDYDFRVLPIETISAIYEHFLTPSERDESGAIYTPRVPTEIVLDMALDTLTGPDELLKRRYLDPACGSGIFLVGLFQRLAEAHRRQNPTLGYEQRYQALVEILTTQLVGIDKNPTACRVAAFSLYLALLDHLEPPNIIELKSRGHMLPPLLHEPDSKKRASGQTLFPMSFGRVDPSTMGDFDIVVGNPPWVSRQGETASEEEEDSNWPYLDRSLPQAARQLAHRFVFHAPQYLRKGGRVCFLLPWGLLFHRQGTEVQRELLNRYIVERVVNLCDLRYVLFEDAIHPALIVRYRNHTEQTLVPAAGKAKVIEYWTPKADWGSLRAGMIDVASDDRHQIDQAVVMAELERGRSPVCWKEYLWATPRDRRLLSVLAAYPRLADRTMTWKELSRSHGQRDPERPWTLGQGFKPASKNAPATHEPWPPGTPFIAARSGLDLLVLPRDCQTIDANAPKLHRKPDGPQFDPPHVLISIGLKAAYCDFRVVFQHAIRGLHGPAEDTELLMFMAAYINSDLARYFLFHTGSYQGQERDKVEDHELLQVPFPLPQDLPEPDKARAIVGQVAELMRGAKQSLGRSDFGRPQFIAQLKVTLRGLIFDYFDLLDSERLLIEDTLGLALRSATPNPNARKVTVPPMLAPSTAQQRSDYMCLLCSTLNDWAAKGAYRMIPVERIVAEAAGMAVLALKRVPASRSQELSSQERHSADNLLALLSRLQKQATQQVGAFSLRREVGMVLDDTLYLIKPLAQRYWSQTSALNDADQIFAAVVRANRRAQS